MPEICSSFFFKKKGGVIFKCHTSIESYNHQHAGSVHCNQGPKENRKRPLGEAVLLDAAGETRSSLLLSILVSLF